MNKEEINRLQARNEYLEKQIGETEQFKARVARLEQDLQAATKRAHKMSERAYMTKHLLHELVDMLLFDRDKTNN